MLPRNAAKIDVFVFVKKEFTNRKIGIVNLKISGNIKTEYFCKKSLTFHLLGTLNPHVGNCDGHY